MSTIHLTKDEAEELLIGFEGDEIDTDKAGTFRLVAELDEIIAQHRWASVRRKIYQRVDDSTHWALDYDHSDVEMHERWTYTAPELRAVEPVERTITTWKLVKA